MKKAILFIATLAVAVAAVSCGNKSSNNLTAEEAAKMDKAMAEIKTEAAEGNAYIEEQMKADPELKKTKSGLVYKIVKPGSGENFKETDAVDVIYCGKHINGQVFDQKTEPVKFPLSNVVPGFREMLMLMNPGAKAYCIIPPSLGYGAQGVPQGGIQPNETLIFELEAVGLSK